MNEVGKMEIRMDSTGTEKPLIQSRMVTKKSKRQRMLDSFEDNFNKMTENPDWTRPDAKDFCYAKDFPVQPVNIWEEKFISLTDVVTSTITSDRPVTLRLEGRSFQNKRSLSLNGSCSVDVASNSVLVREGGTVMAKVSENPEVSAVYFYFS